MNNSENKRLERKNKTYYALVKIGIIFFKKNKLLSNISVVIIKVPKCLIFKALIRIVQEQYKFYVFRLFLLHIINFNNKKKYQSGKIQ